MEQKEDIPQLFNHQSLLSLQKKTHELYDHAKNKLQKINNIPTINKKIFLEKVKKWKSKNALGKIAYFAPLFRVGNAIATVPQAYDIWQGKNDGVSMATRTVFFCGSMATYYYGKTHKNKGMQVSGGIYSIAEFAIILGLVINEPLPIDVINNSINVLHNTLRIPIDTVKELNRFYILYKESLELGIKETINDIVILGLPHIGGENIIAIQDKLYKRLQEPSIEKQIAAIAPMFWCTNALGILPQARNSLGGHTEGVNLFTRSIYLIGSLVTIAKGIDSGDKKIRNSGIQYTVPELLVVIGKIFKT